MNTPVEPTEDEFAGVDERLMEFYRHYGIAPMPEREAITDSSAESIKEM